MSTVQVAVSGLQSGLSLVRPLFPALTQAFQPFGVNLQFLPGTVLAADPEANNSWPDLVSALQRQSHNVAPAHLVVTDTPYNNDGSIDGRLCDPPTRGVVAVYMRAHLYYEGGGSGPQRRPDLLAAVCVHELGHLFNLTHAMADRSDYASAMSQASLRRQQAASTAWLEATAEAASKGEPAPPVPNPALAYPFNHTCRQELRLAATDSARRPFGGPFSGGAGGVAADAFEPFDLDIQVHEDRHEVFVGGPLYLTLTITNPGPDARELPLNLGPAFETVRLVVIDPDGVETSHQARDSLCSGARQRLAPGQRIFRSLSFTGKDTPRLFENPGPHVCRLELIDPSAKPAATLARAQVEVIAQAEPAAEGAARTLREMLDRRAQGVGRAIAPSAAPPSIEAHWELAASMRLRRGPRRAERLGLCLALDAPLAIQHEASRQTVLDGLYRGAHASDLLLALRDRYQGEIHDELHASARRSAESFALRKIREIDR